MSEFYPMYAFDENDKCVLNGNNNFINDNGISIPNNLVSSEQIFQYFKFLEHNIDTSKHCQHNWTKMPQYTNDGMMGYKCKHCNLSFKQSPYKTEFSFSWNFID